MAADAHAVEEAIPPPPRTPLVSRRSAMIAAIVLAVVAIHVISWRGTDSSLAELVDGWDGMVKFIGEAVPPNLNWAEVVRPGIDASLVTLYTAILGTSLAIPGSFLLGALGARNLTPSLGVYQAARSVLSFLRAVPDVVFALIFITAVGLGPFPGVLALLFHTVGVLGKLFAEVIEEMDMGPVEALRVGGASSPQVLSHAVMPAVLPAFVGLALYRFDVNVRASLVLGLVGAGGIGFLINESIKLFRFDEMLTYILIVLVMVVAIDQASAWLRKRIH